MFWFFIVYLPENKWKLKNDRKTSLPTLPYSKNIGKYISRINKKKRLSLCVPLNCAFQKHNTYYWIVVNQSEILKNRKKKIDKNCYKHTKKKFQ